MARHELVLGDLRFGEENFHDDDFWFDVHAEGTTFGNSDPVTEVVRSLLADGDLTRITRFGNREVSLRVEVNGPDLQSVALGEAALRRELGKSNVLTWLPPDDVAAPTAFEVLTSSMSQVFDDLDELRRKRVFDVTLTCAPFARSVDLTTVEPLTVEDSALTVVDDCSTGTGWTATRDSASIPVNVNFWDPSSVGVGELTPEVEAPETWTLTRAGSIDFADSPYLVVTARTTAFVPNLIAYAGTAADVGTPSADALPLLAARMIPGGHTEYTFLTDGGTIAALTLIHRSPAGVPWQVLVAYEVAKTGTPPGETHRQMTRVIETGGTERTPASIHVTSANGTDTIGAAIVHSCPEDGSGYSPPLRRWRATGNTVTTDSNALSGATEPIHPETFRADVPIASLPAGGYLIMGRFKASVAGTYPITWGVSSVFPPSFTGEGAYGSETDVTFFANNSWQYAPLAVVTLPTIRGAGEVRIAVVYNGGEAVTITVDELWAFRVDDDCALTVLSNANPFVHLWLDSADTASHVPTVSIGTSDDRSDAHHPASSLLAMGTHILHPEGTAVFTAAYTDYPETSATFYRRWHSNAAS